MPERLGATETVDTSAPISGVQLRATEYASFEPPQKRALEKIFKGAADDQMKADGIGWFARWYLRGMGASLTQRLDDSSCEIFVAKQEERYVGMGFVIAAPDGERRMHAYSVDPETRGAVLDALQSAGYPVHQAE